MTVSSTPVFPQKPSNGKYQITHGTPGAGAWATVYTGGANGSKIHALIATSTDTSARDIQIAITRSAVQYVLGTVSVPIGAGNSSAAPSVNLLAAAALAGLPLDSDGNPEILLLDASDTLQISPVVDLTAGKVINVIAIGADF